MLAQTIDFGEAGFKTVMITCRESLLQNQASAFQGAPHSPILRPATPFPGYHLSPNSGPNSLGVFPDSALYINEELTLSPLLPLKHARQKCPATMMMENSFEARLGPRAGQENNGATTDGMVQKPRGVVLVVMDVNKEFSTYALDWALASLIQKGDSVKLLGILHHILNPMGYKSRADEHSWNGASRKVLDTQIATHLAMFQSIPDIYTRVKKLGAKLDIEVRANLHAKHLVVEEAKRLDARYIVLDRWMKKDKKFYIENLTCFVTRVKSMTEIEHLRHGVPLVNLDATNVQEEDQTEVLEAIIEIPMQESSRHVSPQPQLQQVQYLQRPSHSNQPQPPTPTSIVMSVQRPLDSSYFDDSKTYENAIPAQMYGPEMMGLAYESQLLMHDRTLKWHAVQHWLTEVGTRAGPADAYGTPDQDYLHNGYHGEQMTVQLSSPVSPLTDATFTNYIQNYDDPYEPVPSMFIRHQSPEWRPLSGSSTTSGSYAPGAIPPSPDSNIAKLRPSSRTHLGWDHSTITPNNYQGLTQTPPVDLRTLMDNTPPSRSVTRRGPAPISVQPRRADASLAFDLLYAELGQHQGKPGEIPHVPNSAIQDQPQNTLPSMICSPPKETTGAATVKDANSVDLPDQIERVSSVRRALSTRKQGPETPPLCTVCQQKSPEFGKLRRFALSELQEATNQFSVDNYLAEGSYKYAYKGRLKEGQLVAIKQHNLASSQGDQEFCSEVEVLNCAQHRNLVTLIGYCVEDRLRLLVYEYVCNGSLERHLSIKNKTGLRWTHRHKIALGTARALRYLHEECRVGCIVHRDMRPNNILLTHDFTPMVGDFGLARRQASGDKAEETRVVGTIGYLAPEYAETGQITDKADVYAFGIVLLELITGRKAIDYTKPRHQVCLTEWARPLLDHYAKELVDPRLNKDPYDEYEMYCMMHAANQCIKKDPAMRPHMTQVLRILNPSQERDMAYSATNRQLLESPCHFPALEHAAASTGSLNKSPFCASSPEHDEPRSRSSDASVGSVDSGYSDSQCDPEILSQQPQSSSTKLWKSKSRVSKSRWKLTQERTPMPLPQLSESKVRKDAVKERLSYEGMLV